MLDVRVIVLHKILSKEEGYLEAWSKLKLSFFKREHTPIYKEISRFYINHSDIPSFSELELYLRNPTLKTQLRAIEDIEVPDVNLDIAVEALVNEYTQELILTELDAFLDKITFLSASEIKEELGTLLLDVEEKTLSSEEIVMMNDIVFIEEEEALGLMPLGLNNSFDADIGGMAPTQVLAVGGYRGSGKSNVCSNLVVNQYEVGNSALYFSIEMRAREVFNRHLSLLSGVPLSNVSKADLTEEQLIEIARVRAEMFVDSTDLFEKFKQDKDYVHFERELIHTKELKPDNQIIIIDNQKLTLANIDMTVQKFKAQFKDKLKLVVVDYLNQIDVPDKFEWKQQIAISAKLKEIARKHDVILVAPYQIDKTGEARFSKGILDSVDIAMILEKEEGKITFTSTKTRGIPPFTFVSPMDELTLRIDPNDALLPPEKEDAEPNTDSKEDLPW